MGGITRPIIPLSTRFWEKVDTGAGPDGCWWWLGCLKPNGYGQFFTRGELGLKRRDNAHRVAYALERGKIKKGKWVLHRCDNRACVNAKHLFLGSAQDNTDDMRSKGRQRHYTLYTDAEIEAVREMFSAGDRIFRISEKTGISQPHVCEIVHLKKRVRSR